MIPARPVFIKSITKFVPQVFFESSKSVSNYNSKTLDLDVTSIDLNYIYWSQSLDEVNLYRILGESHSKKSEFERELDLCAIRSLPKVKSLLSSLAERILTSNELWFTFRVLQRCAEITLQDNENSNLSVHFARGVIDKKVNSYSLKEVIENALNPISDIRLMLKSLLQGTALKVIKSAPICIIQIRNDSDLLQAAALAAQIKEHTSRKTKIVLCAAGANEQFDFGSWGDLFSKNKKIIKDLFDFFIPKQDYDLTLNELVKRVILDKQQTFYENTFSFDSNESTEISQWRKFKISREYQIEVDKFFKKYTYNQGTFKIAGKKTMATRLLNDRCHWSACAFCTINSQHVLRRGAFKPDDRVLSEVQNLISIIKEYNIESLILMDEALHPNVLKFFAEQLIQHNINVVYRVRARFTEEFDKFFAKLLFDSGCRYLGCGLESYSDRINSLMAKHNGKPLNYEQIVKDLDEAGVRPHIYSIQGFPTETEMETRDTTEFLIKAIEESKYVTVSPNLFHLMDGSKIASEPNSFGILGVSKSSNLRLVLDYIEKSPVNKELVNRGIQLIHKAQFSPLDPEDDIAEAFWHFIDQSGIFYLQKVECEFNPYRKDALIKSWNPSKEELSKLRIKKSEYIFSIYDSSDGHYALIDWVSFNYLKVSEGVLKVIDSWDPNLSVGENVQYLSDKGAINVVLDLVQAGLMLVDEKDFFEYSRQDFREWGYSGLIEKGDVECLGV